MTNRFWQIAIVVALMFCIGSALAAANDCPKLRRVPKLKPYTGFLAGSAFRIQDWLIENDCPDGVCSISPARSVSVGEPSVAFTQPETRTVFTRFPIWTAWVQRRAAIRAMRRKPALFPNVRELLIGR